MKKLFLATMLLTSMAGAFAEQAQNPGRALGHRKAACCATAAARSRTSSKKSARAKAGLSGSWAAPWSAACLARGRQGNGQDRGYCRRRCRRRLRGQRGAKESHQQDRLGDLGQAEGRHLRNFEQEAKPVWQTGSVVKVSGNTLAKS